MVAMPDLCPDIPEWFLGLQQREVDTLDGPSNSAYSDSFPFLPA